MLKNSDLRRDGLTIVYFFTVLIAISLFFGKGSISYFLELVQELYPLGAVWDKMQELVKFLFSEGTLGMTKHGESFESVTLEFFKKSLPIIISAFILAIPLGIAKGMFDFRTKHTRLVPMGSGFTSFITSLPDFFLILAMQWIILYNFRFIDWFGSDQWYNFLIPSLLVSLYPLMYFARITYAALSNEEGEMYIQTAKAMGLTERLIIKKHILKKCMVSILQHMPTVMTYVLSNLLMVEWLLDYKGAAWRFLYAIQRIAHPKFSEAGLAIEFSLCFMSILFFSQTLSAFMQHKYLAEKNNLLPQIASIFIRYTFVTIFISLIFIFVSVAPPSERLRDFLIK